MVDAGLNDDTCFDAFCGQVAGLGIAPGDIRWLLITHFHPDHLGLAGRVKEATGARVIMHEADLNTVRFIMGAAQEFSQDLLDQWAVSLGVAASEIEGYQQVMSFGANLFPAALEPDVVLQGEESPVGDAGNLRAILTPGHTPGHVCVYDKDNRLLFSGDHVLVEITTNISPSYLGESNQLGQYLSALERLRQLDVRLVLPAHEEPFSHLNRRIDELLEHHERRLSQVLEAVSARPLSPHDVACQVNWTGGGWEQMNGMDRLLAIMETLAHLHLLQKRGRVNVGERGGTSLYGLAAD